MGTEVSQKGGTTCIFHMVSRWLSIVYCVLGQDKDFARGHVLLFQEGTSTIGVIARATLVLQRCPILRDSDFVTTT